MIQPKHFHKNKKANIPVTILVIGIVAICTFAIFSFYFSGEQFKKGMSDISVIEEIKVQKERIDFYENLGSFSPEQIEELFEINTKENDNVGIVVSINKTKRDIYVEYKLN